MPWQNIAAALGKVFRDCWSGLWKKNVGVDHLYFSVPIPLPGPLALPGGMAKRPGGPGVAVVVALVTCENAAQCVAVGEFLSGRLRAMVQAGRWAAGRSASEDAPQSQSRQLSEGADGKGESQEDRTDGTDRTDTSDGEGKEVGDGQ